jgi:hypothetical protein
VREVQYDENFIHALHFISSRRKHSILSGREGERFAGAKAVNVEKL